MLQNIWLHPKTSIAGLLIGIATVAGVLSQQGVTLGKAGTGTVVALVAAIATALLGLLARDPAPAALPNLPSSPSGPVKLGVIMLCCVLVSGLFASGCSGTQAAQDIVNWTPALEAAIATVDSTAAILAPQYAPIFTAATVGFDAAGSLIVTQAKAYLANPSASVLAQLQTGVVTFEQQVNAALLAAARIVDPASQAHALAAIQGVGAIVNAWLGTIASISSKSAIAKMTAAAPIKLGSVMRFENFGLQVALLQQYYGDTDNSVAAYASREGQVLSGYAQLQQQGF